MKKQFKDLQRSQLLRKISSFSSLPILFAVPPEGWIRTVRKALGMTMSQLSKRLHVQQSRISEIEKAEPHDQLTLKTLRAAATALGCRLEYVFIPEKPLEDILREKALKLAREKIAYVSHHMDLENQSTSEEEKMKQVQQLAEELLKTPQRLWESE